MKFEDDTETCDLVNQGKLLSLNWITWLTLEQPSNTMYFNISRNKLELKI